MFFRFEARRAFGLRRSTTCDVSVFLSVVLYVCPGCSGGVSVLDIEDGAGTAGLRNKVLAITLTNAKGLTSLSFSLDFDPSLMMNVRLWRGGETQDFGSWLTEIDEGAIEVTGETSQVPVQVDNAEVALLIFDVSSLAQEGEEVPLILDNASGSEGFQVYSDLGRFVVGTEPPPETERILEIGFSRSNVVPGDRLDLLIWLNDTPLLSQLQVFLDYREGILREDTEKEIGGELVEDLAWDGFFTPAPSVLLTTFTANATQEVPLGKRLVARVPVVVGGNWGTSTAGIDIGVSEIIALGDTEVANTFYNANGQGARLYQPRPDPDGDNRLTPRDLFEFTNEWGSESLKQ